jgi:hypothetical protein
MNAVLKNILAIVSGLILGSVVNMGIIMLSPVVIPPPAGVDVSNMESLKVYIHLFEPRHFIMPFLAHALGTLSGAFIATLIAANRKMLIALVIAVFFLAGGIANVFMLPSPAWFNITDLVLAYIPMGWLGWRLAPGK